MPELTAAFFRCQICGFETYSFIENGKMVEPVYCIDCKNFHSFQLIYRRSSFSDKQFILLQEIPKTTFKEENLSTLILVVSNNIKNKIQIGDYIESTGILRISSFKKEIFNKFKAFFRFYLEVLCVKWDGILFFDKNTPNKNYLEKKKWEKKKINNEILIKKHSLIQQPKLYLNYSDTIAPNLLGFETLKQLILITIIQSFKNNFNESFSEFERPISTLFVGKNGIAKSQFLRFIVNMTKTASFLDGKNFIFSNTKESRLCWELGKYNIDETIEIFSSSNKRFICVDNITKLPKEISSLFYETIRNNSLSIARKGIVNTVKKKASFIGIIDIPNDQNEFLSPSLNSSFQGFDFMYFIKDSFSNFQDKRLANHILSLYFGDEKKKTTKQKNFLGIGLKSKSFIYFVYSANSYSCYFFSEFSKKEAVKWKTRCAMIKKLKFGSFFVQDILIWELLIIISQNFSALRFSNLVSLEDIRFAGILFLEALLSWKAFPK